MHDALRAAEWVGVTNGPRFRAALRLVCCGTREEIPLFERAFAAFFLQPELGVAQPAYQPRHTRPPDREQRPPERESRNRPSAQADGEDGIESNARAAARGPAEQEDDDATAWQAMRARYSPMEARAEPLEIGADDFAAMSAAASHLIASVRLGRSRRWKAMDRGSRFDLRRTIRASLQTGGDPVDLRWFGHPPRNPRFVVLVDGSRSMSEHTAAVLQFSHALAHRSARTNVFVFSTALRDVTRELHAIARTGGRLSGLGAAWGGGTKIGASLAAFVKEHGARLLTSQTVVIIFSDGFDVGDLPQLEGALREIDRRSAALVWLNPYAALPGYGPTARGMRAALPFVSLLGSAADARGFVALARRLARNPRIRGRRR